MASSWLLVWLWAGALSLCLQSCHVGVVAVLPAGDWVRYRSDFHQIASGFNQKSLGTFLLHGAPAAIFYPSNESELAQLLNTTFAPPQTVDNATVRQEQEFAFSVRSGGHSFEGLSSTSCSLTIDTSLLNSIEILEPNDQGALVKVGAGVRHRQLYEALDVNDLVTPGAKCMDVGFTGCALGGCHGFLSSAFGLSSDNVRSIEIILANSTQLTVSSSEYSELFWALRGGGGGDFGVVTSMIIAAHRVRNVVGYELRFELGGDLSLAVDLIKVWQQWALRELPSGTSAFLKCSSALLCTARGVLPREDESAVADAAQKLAAPFATLEMAPQQTIFVSSYLEALQRFEDCHQGAGLEHRVKTLYFNDAIPNKVLQTGLEVLQRGTTLPQMEWNGVELQLVGFAGSGASSAPSTADLYHRNQLLVELSASWTPVSEDEQESAHVDWIRQVHAALSPTSTGAYRNFEDLDNGAALYTEATWSTHPAAFYYPDDALLTLSTIKSRIDPDGVFQHALSATFDAVGKAQHAQRCRTQRWTAPPEPLRREEEDPQPPARVLVGVYDQFAAELMTEEALEAASQKLTHVVFSALEPRWLGHGHINISFWHPEFDKLKHFEKTVRRAHPGAKRLLSLGGGNASHTNRSRDIWSSLLMSDWQRGNLMYSVRQLVDEYNFDGVDVDLYPDAEERTVVKFLLQDLRNNLGPDAVLTVQVDVDAAAVDSTYARDVSSSADLIFLRTFDLEPLVPEQRLRWLAHLNANLFSPNPALASAAAGVANWIDAGAPRSKLVLGVRAYGYAFEVDGPAPASAGRLDWPVLAPSAHFGGESGKAGVASWVEVQQALGEEGGGWTLEHLPLLGGAAAWSEQLRTWVGFDSPDSVRQKAEWARSMGLRGAVLGPLHMDAFGAGQASLTEALGEGLSVEIVMEDSRTAMIVWVTLAAAVPALLMVCCVHSQLRRWDEIRKMHDGLSVVARTAGSWNSQVHASYHDPGPDAEGGGSLNQLEANTPSAASLRRQSSRRSSIGLRVTSSLRKVGSGLKASSFFRTASARAVQSAFDGAMQSGQTADEQRAWGNVSSGVNAAALRALTDRQLSRRLALISKAEIAEKPSIGVIGGQNRGYEAQRGMMRYSRLLTRDVKDWLDDPQKDYLNFYATKKRGVIKMTAVVTMYAETPDLLERSLEGIAHGIHELATETAFLRSWDEAVVVIVQDGRSKMNPDTADWLQAKGIYNKALIEDAQRLDKAMEGSTPQVALHCFEALMQFGDLLPTQTMLIIKEHNAGKLDSQRWAFTGICERLMPAMPPKYRRAARTAEEKFDLNRLTFHDLRALDRYLVTVDAGTEPKIGSLRELLLPMRYDPKIAGTCGHMIPDKTFGNLMVQSQVFEYEHGHIVDKSMEAMFGFISVLPGAYSAFRYDAIRRDQWIDGAYRREGPLVEYFQPLITVIDSPELLNMGLAEDRFLCFSLMTMRHTDHCLWYCRRAVAVTDVPDTLQGFLQQRRRWNNGAFFTRLHTIRRYADMFKDTNHGLLKRMGFVVQLLMQIVDALFVWFSAAMFYLWITFTVDRLGSEPAEAVAPAFLIMYLLALIAHYDRKVSDIKWVHWITSGLLAAQIVFCVAAFIFDQTRDTNLALISVLCFSFGAMFFCSLLQGKLLKMCAMLGAYLLMYPTYAILAQLYGFCHVHDVSWGTKGIESAHAPGSLESKQQQEREEKVRQALSSFRFRILNLFLLSNFIFGWVVGYYNRQYSILLWLILFVVGVNAIRYLGSISYTVVTWLDSAMKLTAMHGLSREFGDEYEQMQAHVARINMEDLGGCKSAYFAIRERSHYCEKQRRQARLMEVEAALAPANLSTLVMRRGMFFQAHANEPEEADEEAEQPTADFGPEVSRERGAFPFGATKLGYKGFQTGLQAGGSIFKPPALMQGNFDQAGRPVTHTKEARTPPSCEIEEEEPVEVIRNATLPNATRGINLPDLSASLDYVNPVPVSSPHRAADPDGDGAISKLSSWHSEHIPSPAGPHGGAQWRSLLEQGDAAGNPSSDSQKPPNGLPGQPH